MAKRQARTRRQAASPETPRREDATAAATQQPKPGPSAATWPETQQRGAAARPKTKRAAHRRIQRASDGIELQMADLHQRPGLGAWRRPTGRKSRSKNSKTFLIG